MLVPLRMPSGFQPSAGVKVPIDIKVVVYASGQKQAVSLSFRQIEGTGIGRGWWPRWLSNLRGKAFIQISMLEEVLLGPWLF